MKESIVVCDRCKRRIPRVGERAYILRAPEFSQDQVPSPTMLDLCGDCRRGLISFLGIGVTKGQQHPECRCHPPKGTPRRCARHTHLHADDSCECICT